MYPKRHTCFCPNFILKNKQTNKKIQLQKQLFGIVTNVSLRARFQICLILKMGRFKLRGVTCPRSHSYSVAEPGLKIDCSCRPLLWKKKSANNGLHAKMASWPNVHPKIQDRVWFCWLVKCSWLPGEKNLHIDKHSLIIYFKQNTVYVENMILAFEEDSVLSMISHVPWELEGKEELKK